MDSVDSVDYEHYVAERRRSLYRFAVVLCGDPAQADELTADVLGMAFERWAQVSAADNVHAYVRRMLVNEFLGWRRRLGRVRAQPDLELLLAPVADHAHAHAEQTALAGELRTLPRRQRAALVLRYYEGLSYPDIAAELGCSESAVRSNVSRALAALRVQLTPTTEQLHPTEARP